MVSRDASMVGLSYHDLNIESSLLVGCGPSCGDVINGLLAAAPGAYQPRQRRRKYIVKSSCSRGSSIRVHMISCFVKFES